ncbi:PREDICTED: tripartite motif-containing protein 40 [Miniopterus natalensis]|uniref:tripartite motif-containing protein 40 n=1 Tax=Miniopterus natalensis TaxID=291302 RepID=UPI0007A716DF|nr:PREDICTED: tripartite motif-containing protein 40 [Miniopterus natalensis]
MASLQEKPREEGIWPICQESLTEAVSTDCGRLFCRARLAQRVEKASASGVFGCPLCRKPCSEGVLGEGHICHSHQKVSWFCEESRLLLCVECLVSPEHESHRELAIEDAIRHYKPCSEGVLGEGHICHSHQKVSWFCEESRLLLCVECLVSPEHESHRELAIEDAIRHYKDASELLTGAYPCGPLPAPPRAFPPRDPGGRSGGREVFFVSRSAPQELEALYPKFQKRVDK